MSLTSKVIFTKNKVFKTVDFLELNFLDENNQIAVYFYLKKTKNYGIKRYTKIKKKLQIELKKFEGIDLNNIKITKKILNKIFKTIKEFQEIKINNNKNIIQPWDYKKFDHFFIDLKLNDYQNKLLWELKNLKKILLSAILKEKLVLSHNDLHKGNFLIIKEKIQLVDFDFTTLNFDLADCASIIQEFNLNNSLKNYWINKLWKLDKKEKGFLLYLIKYQVIIWYFWANWFYKKTKNKKYKKILTLKVKQIKNIFKI